MRISSPDEMLAALDNCYDSGPCTHCPYRALGDCHYEILRDAGEIIRRLKEEKEAQNDDPAGNA